MDLKDITEDSRGIQSGLTKIMCPVLKRNCRRVFEEMEWSQKYVEAIICGDMKAAEAGFNEQYDESSTFLNLYPDQFLNMKSKFGLSSEQVDYLSPLLEGLAVTYLGGHYLLMTRPMAKDLHSNLTDLNCKLGSAIDGIDEELENFEIIVTMISQDSEQTRVYKNAFESLVSAREQLKSLPDFIRNAPLVQAAEFDKAARSTNWALYTWTEALYSLWFNFLGRTIENKNDGLNGRKHLLEFLDFCIRPIHQAIEFETLDNMLRKVQKDVERRGGLSSPNFKLGSSSPFGAFWSKSES